MLWDEEILGYMIQGCYPSHPLPPWYGPPPFFCGPRLLWVLFWHLCCVGDSPLPPVVPVVLVVLSMWFCSSPLWTLWLVWSRYSGGSPVRGNLCVTVLSTVQTARRSGVSFLHRHRGAGSPYTRTLSIGHHALMVGHVPALAGNSKLHPVVHMLCW